MSDYIKQKKEIQVKFVELISDCGTNVSAKRIKSRVHSLREKIRNVNYHYDDDIKLIQPDPFKRKYKLEGCE